MSAGAKLLGIGTATPPGRMEQARAAALAAGRCATDDRERAWLQRIYRASGVARRGSVLLGSAGDTAALEAFYPLPATLGDRGPTTAARLARYAETAAGLAAEAASAALANGNIRPGEITHLVTVSCTGLGSPGVEMDLIERLNLSPNVGRLNLGFMGCHGALNGLRAAQALAVQDPGAAILLCCVELCTLHFQYGWDRERVVANALFADGAGAMVLTGETGDGMRLRATASRVAADSRAAMTWTVGDHGFEMGLSSEVPALIRGALGPWLREWLARHGLSTGDITHWAVHPGGPKIIQTVVETLALPPAAAYVSAAVLAEHGNMSSPTLLFILQRLRAANAHGPCVALGFGPGLALEAALLEL